MQQPGKNKKLDSKTLNQAFPFFPDHYQISSSVSKMKNPCQGCWRVKKYYGRNLSPPHALFVSNNMEQEERI